MMNGIAIAMLLSTVGLVMVLSPESILVMSSSDGESMLKSVKEVVEEPLLKVEETLMETKDALAKGVEVVTKPIEKSMGWFRRKPKPEDHLSIAKEKTILAKEAMHEASIELKDATLEKLNSITHEAGDKISQVVDATKDVAAASKYKMESDIQKIEQKAEDVAKDAYNYAGDILVSTKEKTYEKIGGTRDSIYDGVGHVKNKLQDVAEGMRDEAYDVGVKTKDTTSNIVEFSKDKINEGAQSTCDVIVDSLQLGLDKTKSIVADVSERVKEIAEHTAHDTKEVGHEILGRIKDATCKSAECLRARTQEASENAGEIGEDAKLRARDFTNSCRNFARQSYDDMKTKTDHYYHEGKDKFGENYDSITDTAQDYYDEVGQCYRNAKDYYDRSTNYHKNRGHGRHYYKGPRDVPSRSYYDVAKDEANDYYNNIKDKTTHAFNGVNYRTRNSYDNVRDKMDEYIPHQHEEGSREYISAARQRIANGYHNVRDEGEDYYKNAKFKPRKDLGTVVESMGWRRIGIVAPDHVPISSDDEVIIGNIKYEWHDTNELPNHETISNHVSNSMKNAAHTIGENVDNVRDHITRSAQNIQDIGIHAKDQTYDALRTPKDDRSQLERHLWTNHGSNFEKYEDDNNGKDDDFITSKKIKNLKGRLRNGRHLYNSQRSKTREHADLIEKDLLGFARYDEDKKKLEDGRVHYSLKGVFLKRPKGFLLLLTRALHLFTFSIVYGSSFWVTFVSSLILSKHIPRQQFGYVQSRIFPVYLRILIAGQCVLFILHSILHPWFIADGVEQWELSNFGLMIASTLINAYILEPQATKVMFERLKVEKEEGRGLENVMSPMDAKLLLEEHKKKLANIDQQFKALHNYSSALNLISLGGLTCHLWHLAHCLVI